MNIDPSFESARVTLSVLAAAMHILVVGLFVVIWLRMRERWMLLIVASYLLFAALFAMEAWIDWWHQHRPTLPAVILMSAAVLEYTQVPARAYRVAMAGLAVYGVVALAALEGLPLSYGDRFAIVAAPLAVQVASMAWAWWREPRVDFVSALVVQIAFMGVFSLSLAGWVDLAAMRYLAILPSVSLSLTMLTTVMLRANALARQELHLRQKAETALQEANAVLEERVRQRTTDLVQVIDGLESFNVMVSHDLRGPIGAIAGAAGVARDALEQGNREPALQLLVAVEKQARDSAQLIQELLALGRASGTDLALETLTLDEVVGEAMDTLQLDAAARRCLVVRNGRQPFSADRLLLRQVFVNLIGNAFKYSRQQAHPRIRVAAAESDGRIVFGVHDNGIGFDPIRSADLFVPFRRLHGRGVEGSGVGLTIVKRIVERHGGHVWADGRPGDGASFYFSLAVGLAPQPVTPEETCHDEPEPAPRSS